MDKHWPAEATLEIAGRMTNIRCPSRNQLRAMINHIGADGPARLIGEKLRGVPINYIVDVGANVGALSLLFHRIFPSASILALEPIAINYRYLLYNTKHFSKIATKKQAAFHKARRLRLSMPSVAQRAAVRYGVINTGLYSAYGDDIEHSEVVNADRLDNIVDRKVDLLKIDVEGAEGAVLDGATRIMTEDRPVLFIERQEQTMTMAGHGPLDYTRYFKSIGYIRAGEYRRDDIFVPKEKIIENSNSG